MSNIHLIFFLKKNNIPSYLMYFSIHQQQKSNKNIKKKFIAITITLWPQKSVLPHTWMLSFIDYQNLAPHLSFRKKRITMNITIHITDMVHALRDLHGIVNMNISEKISNSKTSFSFSFFFFCPWEKESLVLLIISKMQYGS